MDIKALLETGTVEQLKEAKFGKWDTLNNCLEESGKEPVEVDQDIWLIPGTLYNEIPDGFVVTGLYGEEYPFEKDKSDDDTRYGRLPYGVKRPIQ